jgi:hypothetical protein
MPRCRGCGSGVTRSTSPGNSPASSTAGVGRGWWPATRLSGVRSANATATHRSKTRWSSCATETWSTATLIGAASEEGKAHRAAVAEFLTNDGENTSLGIELDVRYDNSPIVCGADDDAPPWDRRTFAPSVRAGHRAPNVVVADDETLFDRFGPAFTLVDAVGGPSDATRLLDEAGLAGLPVRHLVLEDPRLRQLYRDEEPPGWLTLSVG